MKTNHTHHWMTLLLFFYLPSPGLRSAHGLHLPKTACMPWPLTLLYFCILQSTLCLPLWSQPYAINWHTIDGGGGTSTGGVYAVSGTIGQPDAGPTMTNGQYAVTGGFWALPQAVQVPGAPLLSIAAAGPGQATVSWEPDTPGFVLQETSSLSPTNWMNSASGTNTPVVVPSTSPSKFYRLHKP